MVAVPKKQAVPVYADLGRRIKVLREAKGLSQRELAHIAHVHEGYTPKIELGLGRPSPEVLRAIATAIETDYMDLARLAGYADPPVSDVENWLSQEKAPTLRRLADFTAKELERIERMARIMLLSSEPPSQPENKRRQRDDIEGETRE